MRYRLQSLKRGLLQDKYLISIFKATGNKFKNMWWQAANITDQDIDYIIQKGMRATDELNEKMKQFTENAMKFTLDGGFNAYEFKDEDDMPEDVPNLKALAGLCLSDLLKPWDHCLACTLFQGLALFQPVHHCCCYPLH